MPYKDPEAHSAAQRRRRLRVSFGLTVEEYDALLVRQGGVCAICCQPERVVDAQTGKVRRLAADHDHETMEVRGLLCFRCNYAIGGLDSPELVHRLALYLGVL